MIEPCCEKIARLINLKGIGLGARLPKKSDQGTKKSSPMYLHFHSVEHGKRAKIAAIAGELDIPLLLFQCFEINFCPFCGYDWCEYSLDSFQQPNAIIFEIESPDVS